MYNIHLLPALFGDSILIEYGKKSKPSYILIDGGPFYGYAKLMKGLKKVAPNLKELELLVITHIDIDHIDGVVKLLNQKKPPFTINEIWFNGYDEIKDLKSDMLGVSQGEFSSLLIKEKGLKQNETYFKGKAVMVSNYNKLPVFSLKGGMEITLLSPGKEGLVKLKNLWESESETNHDFEVIKSKLDSDSRYKIKPDDLLGDLVEDNAGDDATPDKSVPNLSSIAFIGKYDNKTCLFAGDATSEYLLKAINPILKKSGKSKLKVDAWKLAHHGSKKSNQPALMDKMDTKNMLVSSNGDRYKHPDKECIAKLLEKNKGLKFYFNYYSKQNKVWDDAALQKKYGYKAIYPADGEEGISVKLA
ncbi:MAG: MBL fold metallo-hydrolase [Chitinophagaceae bacterium]|nr:MBL fold metallo-hydrolase [Chitinophagaceae bacterium]